MYPVPFQTYLQAMPLSVVAALSLLVGLLPFTISKIRVLPLQVMGGLGCIQTIATLLSTEKVSESYLLLVLVVQTCLILGLMIGFSLVRPQPLVQLTNPYSLEADGRILLLIGLFWGSYGLDIGLRWWQEPAIYHSQPRLTIFKLTADACIPLLWLLSLSNRSRLLYYWVPLFAGLCLLEGTRYRVVLLLAGVVALHAPRVWLSLPALSKWKLVVAVVGVLFLIQLWSANRWAIANQQPAYLTFDLLANGANPAREFEQIITGAKVLQYSEQQHLGPDFGKTMFGWVLIRFLPLPIQQRLGMATNKKLFPPMLHRVVQGASNGAYRKGVPAYGMFQELWLSFGFGYAIIGASTLGILLALIRHYLCRLVSWGSVLIDVGLAMLLFQWGTRGYLPQQIELGVVLAIALVLGMRLMRQREIIGDAIML